MLSIRHVVIAMIGGICAGLFFGPYCKILNPISEIYFMLLQMVVLPYIPSLLMHGIGSLSFLTAKKLLQRSWFIFLLLWGSALLLVYFFSMLIPLPTSFFSDSGGARGHEIAENILSYLVPKNFFYDLANNIVPAIALFGLIAGISLIWIQHKHAFLEVLNTINGGIEKILYWLAKCAPIVIFTHLADVAGSFRVENLDKIEFYVLIIAIGSLFFTFVLFPILLMSLTHMKYREILEEIKEVCLIPFIVSYPTIAFPFLLKTIRRFFQKHKLYTHTTALSTQAILPLSFTFGQVGNIFMILTVSFLAFYTRHHLNATDSVLLPLLSLPMSFGTIFSSISALQFLLKILHFPDLAFSFFQETSTLTLNFQVLVSVSSILTMTLLILHAHYGTLKVQVKRLGTSLFLCFLGVFFCVWMIRPYIHFPDNFTDLYTRLTMEESIGKPLSVKVYKERNEVPADPYVDLPSFARILKRETLRVGYFGGDIPFCYWNEYGELVGHDVAFAYELAKDLNCRLEFIPVPEDTSLIGQDLDRGFYDIVMSALIMTEKRLETMTFVKPYMELDNVLIVPFKEKDTFKDLGIVESTQGLTIGGIGAYYDTIVKNFPLAHAEHLQDLTPLLEGKIDAVVWSSLASFIWSLSHSNFAVIQYSDALGKRYLSYGIGRNALEWLNFLEGWLILKEQSGFTKAQYNYWILGISPTAPPPRWSVLGSVMKHFKS